MKMIEDHSSASNLKSGSSKRIKGAIAEEYMPMHGEGQFSSSSKPSLVSDETVPEIEILIGPRKPGDTPAQT